MEADMEQAANEIKRLKACINDLISVQALPAIWSGGKPSQIVSALLDMLLEMLSLDFAYARLKDSTGGAPLEMVRLAQDRNLTTAPQMIGSALNSWLDDSPHPSPLLMRNPIGDGDVSVLLLRLGLQAEMGVFVAGSRRADFPTQTERLLLNVAANQAAIGLQEARLLGEQKRVAEELDQRVARRTSQLLAANEELEKEIAERKRAEGALRKSEAFLAEGQKISHTGTWSWNVSSGKVAWSQEHFRIFGFDPEKTEPSFQLFLETVHPEDRSFIERGLDEAVREKSGFDMEFRIALADGSIKHVQGVGRPVVGQSGEVDRYIGTTVDITERKRGEALFAGEKRLLEMIATGVALKEILNALCLIIEEYRSGTLASVLLLRPDGLHLDSVAGPSLPKGWTQQIESLPIGPCAGSCGTAAYRGSSVIVSDIASDPLWDVAEHRASALKHGLRASWSNPVFSSNGKVLGTFCIYYREPRTPTAQDLELIELATHLVRIAIERDRAQDALRTSEQLARSHVEVLMRSLDVLATEAAPEKFIAEMLRTIGQHLHARSVLLWLRNRQDDSLRLQLVVEDDQQVAPHPDHPFVKDPQAWKRSLYFQEMFFTKSPVVCDDIEHDSRIDAEFREYLMKRGRKKFLAIPMFVLGEVRGFIGIQHIEGGAYRPEEIELAQALAHHVMMAAHGHELAEQQRQGAILKERTRMARDIHDTLAQGFTGVIVQLDAAVEALRDEEPEGAAKHIGRARELARESLSEARRSVHALRPQALEKAAFSDALKAIIQNTAAGTSLRADFKLDGEPCQLEPSVEENLLHIGQEALTNALKHAHATEFRARLSFDSSAVRLELRDNGDGFVVDAVHGGGFGLIGMKERAEQIGATLTVLSEPGAGTDIVAVSQYQHS
jgi:PAS domain S-box-containing protein